MQWLDMGLYESDVSEDIAFGCVTLNFYCNFNVFNITQ